MKKKNLTFRWWVRSMLISFLIFLCFITLKLPMYISLPGNGKTARSKLYNFILIKELHFSWSSSLLLFRSLQANILIHITWWSCGIFVFARLTKPDFGNFYIMNTRTITEIGQNCIDSEQDLCSTIITKEYRQTICQHPKSIICKIKRKCCILVCMCIYMYKFKSDCKPDFL